MRKLFLAMLLAHYLVIPAAASEITAPAVPRSGLEMMPEETGDFGNGVIQILQKAIQALQPDLRKSIHSCMEILFAALLLSNFISVSIANKKYTVVIGDPRSVSFHDRLLLHGDTDKRNAFS